MKKNKNKKLSPLVILFIGGIILTIGDIIAAEWVRIGGNYLYVFVMFIYIVGMFFLIESYKAEDIAVASTILVIFNIVSLTIVGILFFNEDVNLTKVIGILLGLVAVILLELGKKKLLV